MSAIKLIHQWLCQLNDFLLGVGRQLAWMCVALMTIAILVQVFYRYILDSALPWPEEAARALMIWMTGFAAPTAYRYGGFVSIDLIREKLPRILRTMLVFTLLILAGIVLIKLLDLALQFFQRGFRSDTSTLRFPWDTTQKLKRAWIYLAMPVCFGGMLLVNLELVIREIGRFFGNPDDFPQPALPDALKSQEH